MPDLGGIEATRRILAEHPDTSVLVLTMFTDDDSVFAAIRARARGYLAKGADAADVLRAITAVGNGEAIFEPTIAERILGFLTRPLSAFDQQVFPDLTPREREILDLIAAGKNNTEIARDLYLRPPEAREAPVL